MAGTELDPHPNQRWAKDFLNPFEDDTGLPLDVMRDIAGEHGLDLEAEYEIEIERLRDEKAELRNKLAVANDLLAECRRHARRGRRRR